MLMDGLGGIWNAYISDTYRWLRTDLESLWVFWAGGLDKFGVMWYTAGQDC